MNTIESFEKQAVTDAHKLEKVVKSCRNRDHLIGARRYFRFWQRKYRNVLSYKPFEEDTFFNKKRKEIILQINQMDEKFYD